MFSIADAHLCHTTCINRYLCPIDKISKIVSVTITRRNEDMKNIIISTVRGQTCCSTPTHYSNSEKISLCTYSLMLCVLQRRSKYKFYIVFGSTRQGSNPRSTYRPRGEHCEVKSFYLPVISACTIYFENVLFIRNFQTFCQFCIIVMNE